MRKRSSWYSNEWTWPFEPTVRANACVNDPDPVPAPAHLRQPAETKELGTRERTGLDDAAAGLDVEIRGDEGDVGEVEDLGAVRERLGPVCDNSFLSKTVHTAEKVLA